MVKRLLSCALTLALVLFTAACSSESDPTNTISMPSSSKDFKGDNYQVVVDSLTKAGFTNVEPKALEDLITGWVTKEGSVDMIEVGGDSLFTTDDNFPTDADIVVSYHSFKPDANKASESAPPSKENSAASEPTASSNPEEEILTVANNKDLEALLTTADPFAMAKEFVAKYKGRTIEFDGYIADMVNHGNFKTRYDILIYAGDFNGPSRGPSFQFNDVNTVSDLHLTGSNIPDSIGAGDNLHIVAEVGDYTRGDLLLLEPVSTEVR